MVEPIRVAKFGGTSMGSAAAMEQAAALVARDPGARFVVVSATSGTTNQLLEMYRRQVGADAAGVEDVLGAIFYRHREMAASLGLAEDLQTVFADLLTELRARVESLSTASDRALDEILSFGERISSILFTQALRSAGRRARMIYAPQLLRTDSRFGLADPRAAEIRERCERLALPLLNDGYTLVTQGFIGADPTGAVTTLGRGGSDYSAALFAEALQAESCWIWTDVNGVFSMDPRVVPSAQVIPEITFGEAAELANFGAKVLHPATLLPAQRAGIKVFVGNTFDPSKGGTWIHPELKDRPLMRAIAVRDRQTLITVTSMRMLNAQGFLARLFALLADHGLSVDLVTTSEVSVALTIDGASGGSSGRSILEDRSLMESLGAFAEVHVEENLSLIALVGNCLSTTPGVAARAFQAVGLDNIRLICHGASANNLCFLVSSGQVRRVASRLHEAFL